MRPYFAIIIDSFRAAIASRVLYILLALITLVFFALGPLHLTESLDWRLDRRKHFEDSEAIVSRLIERGETGKSETTARVWNLLSTETQASVRELYEKKGAVTEDRRGPGGRRGGPGRELDKLVQELNTMIKRPDFYRADDWDRFSVVPEAKSILENGIENLSDDRLRRLNRLLMGKALPGLEAADAATMNVFYWFYNGEGEWNFTSSQQEVAAVASSFTGYWFDKLLLSAGLLIGIIVTANVIPQMFDPGALNLLLSKPITRSGLYLTRFIGGCTQISICAAYLFTGTWLWFGLAIGVWDNAFLWSIPMYILVFAMYYSVSALIGLLYRSPILAVIATTMFWAVCFAVGTSHMSYFALMQNQRLYDPLVTENGVVAVDGFGQTVTWDAGSNAWKVVIATPEGPGKDAMAFGRWAGKIRYIPNQIRPTIAPGSQQVIAGLTQAFPPQPTGFGRYNVYLSDASLQQFEAVGNFPQNTMVMFATDDGMLLGNRDGSFRRWDLETNPRVVTESLGPDEPVRIPTAYSAAMNANNHEVAVHEIEGGQHHVVIYKPTEDGYVRDRSAIIDVDTSEKIKCFVAYANNTIVVVAGNSRIVAVDATSMETLPAIPACETTCGIETIATSPDGRWVAMVYGNQRLWLMDVDNDRKLYQPSVTGKQNASSVSFDSKSRLCVFDRDSRLTVYETASLQQAEVFAPQDGMFEMAYRYVISPFYTVFPKPSEFHKVTNYLSSTRDMANNPAVDLIFEPVPSNPLSPLWSGLGFMVVMLGLSCWIFHLMDF